MQPTKIPYLTHTWNPLAMRCSRVSAGCDNCWHLRLAKRLAANPTIPDIARDAYDGHLPCFLDLEAPLHRRKPAIIGVQFMGDLFHGTVADCQIDQVWAVMERRHEHTFILCTKRPARLDIGAWGPNVWALTSVEDQETAAERIPHLLRCGARIKGLSVEPMLGPVDISPWARNLQWVICGGETGPGARPLKYKWVASLLVTCANYGIPFWFKSWGSAHQDSAFNCRDLVNGMTTFRGRPPTRC